MGSIAVPTVRDIHSAHAYRGGSKLAAGRSGAARSQTRSAEYIAVDLHAGADLRGGNKEAGGVKDADYIAAGDAVGGGEDNGHLGVGDAGERAGDGQAGGGGRARSSGRE